MPTVIYPGPIFGPIRSRRLGHSLGINLLPADGKVCNFDCLYCECGFNADFPPRQKMPEREEVARALTEALQSLNAQGQQVDALTFAGNGEPTGHPKFHEIVQDVVAIRDALAPQARVSLLTNATHLNKPSVRQAIALIDRPCLKLDTVNPEYIDFVDRPTSRYDLAAILEAMQELGHRCIIQTMFMKGAYQGRSVDNTLDALVDPWVEAVANIAPLGVDIYTIARQTPVLGLEKATAEDLERIAQKLRVRGIDVHAYP